MEIIIGIGIIVLIYVSFFGKKTKSNQSKIIDNNNSIEDDLKFMDESIDFVKEYNNLERELRNAELNGTLDQDFAGIKKRLERLQEKDRAKHNERYNVNLNKEEFLKHLKDKT
jgi:hypothetical protein